MDIEDLFGFGLLFGGFEMLEGIVSVILTLIGIVVAIGILAVAFFVLDPNVITFVATGAGGLLGGGIIGAKLQKAKYKYD